MSALWDGSGRLYRWDADLFRDDFEDYVVEHLADTEGVLVVDDAGFLIRAPLPPPRQPPAVSPIHRGLQNHGRRFDGLKLSNQRGNLRLIVVDVPSVAGR
jgi:hypothetical protein